MYPRTNYEMTKKDLEKILDSCKPTPAILIGSYSPATPQENANRAWKSLGDKMGFDFETVRPIEGKSPQWFSAVPSETKAQKENRLKQEAEKARLAEIEKLNKEIMERNRRLLEIK